MLKQQFWDNSLFLNWHLSMGKIKKLPKRRIIYLKPHPTKKAPPHKWVYLHVQLKTSLQISSLLYWMQRNILICFVLRRISNLGCSYYCVAPWQRFLHTLIIFLFYIEKISARFVFWILSIIHWSFSCWSDPYSSLQCKLRKAVVTGVLRSRFWDIWICILKDQVSFWRKSQRPFVMITLFF